MYYWELKITQHTISGIQALTEISESMRKLTNLRITDCNPQMLRILSKNSSLIKLSIDEFRIESDTVIESTNDLLMARHMKFSSLKELQISRILYYDVEKMNSIKISIELGKSYSLLSTTRGLFSKWSLDNLFPKLELIEFNPDT